MPSKKKNSKTPSKLSNSDQNRDFSASPASVSSHTDQNPDKLFSYLHGASTKFPSLISPTAFVGEVVSDADSDSKGCRVWLSESSMVSSAIPPGSLVSVSLLSSDEVLSSFPLSVLPDECARHFGFELLDGLADEAGEFFALAKVFPSCKVLKNGVRLSLDLSYTMGCPPSGRTVFVHPVKCQSSIENENGNLCSTAASCLSLDCCKELYLSPVCLKGRVEMNCETENGHVQDSKISSPRTPFVSESKPRSPYSTQSHTSNSVKLTSKSANGCVDMLNVEQVLGNDSSRKLLEVCIISCLYPRTLLSRNFVVVPILSGLCVLQVVGSKGLFSNCEIWNRLNDFPARDPDLVKDRVLAFSIDWDMKIQLLSTGTPRAKTSSGDPLVDPILADGDQRSSLGINFPRLGGLSKEFATLKNIIVSSIVQISVARLGLRPTKGVLLHGPPGTGKTTLAQVCVHKAGVNMFSVNGPEIISQYHGETEQALHEVFNKASQASPAVVFIDELDAIAPARKDGGDGLSQRMVATLLSLMDGVNRNDGILIIAATNRPDSVDPALRRPGRLDREIEIGVPSPGQRHEILLAVLNEMQHSLSNKDIQDLAMVTHGFVGADLAALCNEAALIRLRKYVKSSMSHDLDFEFSSAAFGSVCCTSSQPQDVFRSNNPDDPHNLGESVRSNLEVSYTQASETDNSLDLMDENRLNGTHVLKDTLSITSEDFEKARVRVRPSAMREIILEVPKVCWEDVGGQMEVKSQLMEAVQWPQKHMGAFERIGTRPPRGILLFGPPGCSKTLLARAVASEAGLSFLAVKGPELFSKWVGESEKAVRSLFAKARANAPSIIFFDEIDGLAIIRGKESDGVSVGDRVISQLLVELDGLQQRGSVTVIAATNRPDKLDPALLRPGRFDRLLYVGPPNQKDREDIFRVHLHRMPCSSDVCISELSVLTEGCTGADIALVCHEAAMEAMEENLCASEITMKHFKVGVEHVQPTDVGMYEELSTKFQRLVRSTAKDNDQASSSDPSHNPLWARISSALPFFSWIPHLRCHNRD